MACRVIAPREIAEAVGQHELAARRQVDELREEAERIQAELSRPH
ncbi:hypothetical protein ACFQ51_45300 [Streptomyces kaempferi]